MDRTYGFRLLDDATYRDKLNRELRRVGYRLGDYHTDEPLLREVSQSSLWEILQLSAFA